MTTCIVGSVSIAGCTEELRGVDISSSASGPEYVVQEFFTAMSNGDVETANEVLHPESPMYPIEEAGGDDEGEISDTDIEEVSPRELVDWNTEQERSLQLTDEEITEFANILEQYWKEKMAESQADEFSFVLLLQSGFSEQLGEAERAVPFVVVQQDDDWYIMDDSVNIPAGHAQIVIEIVGDDPAILAAELNDVRQAINVDQNGIHLNFNHIDADDRVEFEEIMKMQNQGTRGPYNISIAENPVDMIDFNVVEEHELNPGETVPIDMTIDLRDDTTLDDIPANSTVTIAVDLSE